MPLFKKPQEKKESSVRAGAQAGKRALSKDKRGFRVPFFGKKKEVADSKEVEKPKEQKKESETSSTRALEQFGSASEVILRPRVTEKGTDVAGLSNAYVFDVHTGANKREIAHGIKEIYGVDPVKVHVTRVSKKSVRSRRGQKGVKSGGKKAYVYLKKGDTIEFV